MTDIVLPNVRKLFVPDPGYTMFEADLKGADAQIVAWEAEDEDLKAAFRAGLDVHSKNAEDMWGTKFTSLHRDSPARYKLRQNNKVATHLTNYGGTARAIAMSQGWTMKEAEKFQHRWFSIHPKIKTHFQDRVKQALSINKIITNIYGFRRVYFDRMESSYTEALAWKPQSTVAICSFKGAFQMEEQLPYAQILLQNHDSVIFQVPDNKANDIEPIRKALTVLVPFADPLYLPVDITRSKVSWGDCKRLD